MAAPAATSASGPAPTPDELRRRYFTFIAPKYAHLTGNTTRDAFTEVLKQHGSDLGITNESIIHDVAAGPGSATQALLPWCAEQGVSPKKIVLTDYVAGMLESAPAAVTGHANVEAKVVDSAEDLSAAFPEDGCLTHVIDNFSVSTFGTKAQHLRALREDYRTLRPEGGVAVFTTWKRFAISEIIGAAQARVKGPDWAATHPVPMNGPEFMTEGYLASMLVEAGWAPEKTRTSLIKSVVTSDADEQGLLEFMQVSPPAKAATAGWADDEVTAWPAAVQEAVDAMKKEYGGIYGEAWVVIARK
ncbi:S-adenosyl-L-methionine-dependent methyltransferase [Apiospora kogelbergensis]|uniref:S-adenosyl-L-methionine-dependent methyltransferase n=1 Tax=Apiospora kogelbergensis TaxID=1337665 RepID=UPI00312F208E